MSERILSVGIDIGTSTTSIVFSDLLIENVSAAMGLPKAQIAEKTVRYRSKVYMTPLISNTELNMREIGKIVEQVYQDAGVRPEDVKTGAVIITGDTARKSNSQAALSAISKYAGDFVVAAAGPILESVLAGKGSGAEKYSIDNKSCILNFDIGGGTTNSACFSQGKLIDADCMDIGGRLIRFREGTQIVEYVFPKIRELAERQGIVVKEGELLKTEEIMRITKMMALALMEKIGQTCGRSHYDVLKTLETGKRLQDTPIKAISFSGGVGELIYDKNFDELFKYNDIGVCLAKSVSELTEDLSMEVVRPTETISATVIGAGTHTMEVSGATITISDISRLPMKNLPIIKLENLSMRGEQEARQEIERKISWSQGSDKEENVALGIFEENKLRFKDICLLAEKLVDGTRELMKKQKTLVIVTKDDYGKVLGQSIQVRAPRDKNVICIDSVDVSGGDYLDIGKPLGIGDAVPVVIKTIAFDY